MLSRVARLRPHLPRLPFYPPSRLVSNTRTSGAAAAAAAAVPELRRAAPAAGRGEVSPYVKNPDYHGFSSDPEVDRWNMRIGFFFGISLALVIGGAFIHYLPDHGMRQWARREAERLIQEREKEDLPLIEENYYDPSRISQPTAEGS